MCNLYSQTKPVQGILDFTRAVWHRVGNLPPQPGVYPDYSAPMVRNSREGRELVMARWGMPSPAFAIKGRNSDPGVTNVRNVASPHWRRWLGVENRCVVPFTSFAEPEPQSNGSRPPAWFAFDETRPLAFFAGIHCCGWKSVRKVKEGETVNDLCAFLTCDPNKEVGVIHPKAMPVILRTPEEVDRWMTAPASEIPALQRPLPDGMSQIVARGAKEDRAPGADYVHPPCEPPPAPVARPGLNLWAPRWELAKGLLTDEQEGFYGQQVLAVPPREPRSAPSGPSARYGTCT